LVAAALAGCEADEALELAAAVRARFGAILAREVWGDKERTTRFLQLDTDAYPRENCIAPAMHSYFMRSWYGPRTQREYMRA
jgi:hypothetical protein